MARTTINSQGVPAGTITASDLTFPLADFSSTGIDDNASSTSLTIDSSGNIAVTGTVDGRDLATDGTKLDNIEANADVTDATNVTAAGALMDSELTDLAGVKGVTISTLQPKPSEGAFANGDKTKLDGIATGADVTPSWVPSSDPSYLTSFDITTQTDSKYLRSDTDDTISGALNVGSAIGTRANSLSVAATGSQSPIAAKTNQYATVSAVLPWSSGSTYLSSGIYYDDGTWVHASDNAYNCLLEISGANGARWYASSNSTGSWNTASNVNLWNASGYWNNALSTNVTYNGSTIWHAGNDGSGSGLDADTVDGVQASGLMQLGTSSTSTTTQVFSISAGQPMLWRDTNATNGTNCNIYSYWYAQSTTLGYIGYGSGGDSHLYLTNATVGSLYLGASSANGFLANGNVMWHAGNDGSGSTLDADTVDGIQGASFVRSDANDTIGGDITFNGGNNLFLNYNGSAGSPYIRLYTSGTANGYWQATSSGNVYLWNDRSSTGLRISGNSASSMALYYNGAYHTLWNSANDGSGSGLDADTVDGLNVAQSGANVIIRTQQNGYILLDNWMRVGNGTGIYCPNGAYIYNDTTYGWYSRSSGSSNSSIRLQVSNGTNVGWWYADTGYNQGFLTSGGGWSFKVDNSGNATATGNVTAYSDARLKENIQPLENSLTKILQLRGVEYTRKDTGSQEIGVIAQEVEEVLPEVVHISDATAEDDNEYTDIRSVDYGRMVSVLIEAMKEQQAQIEELKEIIKCQ